MIAAVVFDMDGVLLDSEQLWDEVRESLARERGGRWHDQAQADMMGMSSPEWSRYMHDVVGLAEPPEEINAEVVRRLLVRYRESLPLIGGAVEAVERLAARWPLGVASSSNREVIDAVLEAAGIADKFKATVSSEEVARGKPAPDVYLEAARRLGVDATRLCRDRGLAQRDPLGARGRDARPRDPEPALPAERRRPRRRRRRPRLARRADARAGQRFLTSRMPSRTVRSTHSTRSSASTWSLNVFIGSSPSASTRPLRSALSARSRPSGASIGSTAS